MSHKEVKMSVTLNSTDSTVEKMFTDAGVRIAGDQPGDIDVHNPHLFERILREGSMGLGEAYMDGWFDSDHLDEFICSLFKADLANKMFGTWKGRALILYSTLFNPQSYRKAFEVGTKHYDLGNDLFEVMLGKVMAYSCAYWKDAKTLEEAQTAKLELICSKLMLKKGMRVLDIGCGWGAFAHYAATQYGAEVVGITVSQEQANFTREKCQGLPIEIRFQDYRELNETFDRIVSVGQFEHVGCKNYRTFMQVARRCLSESGLFLLHTIGGNTSSNAGEPWIEKYIFPNAMIPSAKQITTASEGLFVMEDWHNFGPYYDKTLMAWHERFEAAWPKLRHRYDERFRRMWNFYLLSCAAAFRARYLQLWQIVYTKQGYPGVYPSVR